jgi:hypothetical protein
MTADAGPPVPPDSPPAPPATNGLGLAGFIVSLVGLVPCGLGCPAGLVVSLLALRKEPRGFAIAGAVIGAIGSLLAVVLGVCAYVAYVNLRGTGGMRPPLPEETPPVRTLLAMNEAEQAIQLEQVETGRLPSESKGNELIAELRDGWDRRLRYEPRDDEFTIRSAGPDGVLGNADDVTVEGR